MAVQMTFGTSVSLLGDGVSTSFSFDITKGPVNFDVGDNVPVGIEILSGPLGATAFIHKTVVTVTVLSAADLSSFGEGTLFTFQFFFKGVK